MTNAFTQKPDLSRFLKESAKSRITSRAATKAAEKQNVVQSPSLPIFKKGKK